MIWWKLQQLKSRHADTRCAALRKLADESFDEALAPLQSSLKDAEASVRAAAVETLGQFKNHAAQAAILEMLADPEVIVRESALKALRPIVNATCVEPLVRCLSDSAPSVRAPAARMLDGLGWHAETSSLAAQFFINLGKVDQAASLGAIAVEPLAGLLQSGAYHQRIAAVEALSRIGDARVMRPLLAALKDDDPQVRSAVAAALRESGDKRCIEPLILALRDAYSEVRVQAVHALGQLADPSVVAHLPGAVPRSRDSGSDRRHPERQGPGSPRGRCHRPRAHGRCPGHRAVDSRLDG
jgi:HEAT repeat protein